MFIPWLPKSDTYRQSLGLNGLASDSEVRQLPTFYGMLALSTECRALMSQVTHVFELTSSTPCSETRICDPASASIHPESLPPEATPPQVPLPDVGIRPWLQVVAGFFLMFNAWGTIFSFGVFQTFYTSPSGSIKDNKAPSAIAWIGSLQTFLLLFGGAMSGICFDKGYFRYMILLGTFFVVIGMMFLSLATSYYQVLLSQGLCVGLGLGLLLVPSVGLPSTWFVKHRGIAVGLVSSGASIAGIVLPTAARALISTWNFQWAARILAFLSLASLAISISLARQRLPPRGRGSLVEYRALRQPEFTLYIFGLFLSMFGLYTFYGFIEVWAVSSNVLNRSKLQPAYILPILNAASLVGRIGPSYCSDLLGPLNIQAPALLLCGILVLVWLKVQTTASFLIVVVLYGIASGAVIAMPPVVISSMTEDMTTFGGRMGVFFLAISCSSLAGPPINGAIIQAQNMAYDGTRIFSGVVIILGAGFLGAARMTKSKLKLYVKV
ncbi:uncharacterized protein A1O9_12689 [Exophiala aquamarina CBS 119918]|uniref:Major facilitator superfamily (MFS) profile domain-containing protein n=1 Tax=Exophiala aquamarina CBS 119918 TaxID=1182545 RepID=A0A072NU08_9EURO|nr:uncharacterized protein A1O9_12689 [Exophiala aquamarina CBS 119918]KEF51339.1 hypothetical protein A1O9_12689 [Exophiala aquamarina CBS 119918]